MSDVSDPIDFIYQRALELRDNLKLQKKYIDFMRAAGEDVTALEIAYRNAITKFSKWQTALKEAGKVI
jgi:hypothetical protein